MSRLSNFTGKPKMVTVEGEEFKVYPLETEDEYLFADAVSKDKLVSKSARFELIKKSLRDEADVKKEEIDLKVFNLFVDAIMDVNGYGGKVKKGESA